MADETRLSTVGEAKKMIIAEIGNETTQQELVKTVFKGLSVPVMKQAVLEGALRGFTFKDFLEKNVYAIKYGQGYSLVTSVDFNRKLGMKGGIVGTDAPVYEIDESKKMVVNGAEVDKPLVISCSVTVKKLFEGGHIGEFTAQVFFDEYYKAGKTWEGKYTESMWDQKPRTMIAKVAEMHALRKACPEELSQSYIEEEIGKENVVTYVMEEPEVPEAEVKEKIEAIKGFEKLTDLQSYYADLGKPYNMVQDIIDAYETRKQELSDS
jgi:hypothetical protein